jgi:hypothetical protein
MPPIIYDVVIDWTVRASQLRNAAPVSAAWSRMILDRESRSDPL